MVEFGISRAQAQKLLGTLTPRERDVAGGMAKGWPRRHIAKVLGISEKTFDMHLCRVRKKLGVSCYGIGRIWFAAVLEQR